MNAYERWLHWIVRYGPSWFESSWSDWNSFEFIHFQFIWFTLIWFDSIQFSARHIPLFIHVENILIYFNKTIEKSIIMVCALIKFTCHNKMDTRLMVLVCYQVLTLRIGIKNNI